MDFEIFPLYNGFKIYISKYISKHHTAFPRVYPVLNHYIPSDQDAGAGINYQQRYPKHFECKISHSGSILVIQLILPDCFVGKHGILAQVVGARRGSLWADA